MKIRDERAGDEETIRRVHLDAFRGDLEARLVDLLRERRRAVISLVAEDNGHVVGHILFSHVTVDGAPDCRALGLAPLGVLSAFQRRGVGASLVREGLARCTDAGYDFAVLVGDPAYYTRFGFHPAKARGLDNEYGVIGEAERVAAIAAYAQRLYFGRSLKPSASICTFDTTPRPTM